MNRQEIESPAAAETGPMTSALHRERPLLRGFRLNAFGAAVIGGLALAFAFALPPASRYYAILVLLLFLAVEWINQRSLKKEEWGFSQQRVFIDKPDSFHALAWNLLYSMETKNGIADFWGTPKISLRETTNRSIDLRSPRDAESLEKRLIRRHAAVRSSEKKGSENERLLWQGSPGSGFTKIERLGIALSLPLIYLVVRFLDFVFGIPSNTPASHLTTMILVILGSVYGRSLNRLWRDFLHVATTTHYAISDQRVMIRHFDRRISYLRRRGNEFTVRLNKRGEGTFYHGPGQPNLGRILFYRIEDPERVASLLEELGWVRRSAAEARAEAKLRLEDVSDGPVSVRRFSATSFEVALPDREAVADEEVPEFWAPWLTDGETVLWVGKYQKTVAWEQRAERWLFLAMGIGFGAPALAIFLLMDESAWAFTPMLLIIALACFFFIPQQKRQERSKIGNSYLITDRRILARRPRKVLSLPLAGLKRYEVKINDLGEATFGFSQDEDGFIDLPMIEKIADPDAVIELVEAAGCKGKRVW